MIIELLEPSAKCIQLIKHYEGFEEWAYQDGKGVWTVGYGFTRLYGRMVRKGDFIAREDAENILSEKVEDVGERVRQLFSAINLKQNQFDALVSFAYNLGYNNLKDSTLRKVVKINPNDIKEISYQFSRWKYVAGKVSNGLIARRKSEATLYEKGVVKWYN